MVSGGGGTHDFGDGGNSPLRPRRALAGNVQVSVEAELVNGEAVGLRGAAAVALGNLGAVVRLQGGRGEGG